MRAKKQRIRQRYGVKFTEVDEPCPYLPGRQAVLPFYLAEYRSSPDAFDQALAEGVRRSGIFVYHTQCPGCRACEPIRIPVEDFTPRRRHRRVLAKAEAQLRLEIGPPQVDDARVALYNRHKLGRGLGEPGSEVDEHSLEDFLGATCCETREFRIYRGSELVGVSIADLGRTSMSAVYCYYEPALADLSLGTYAVLKQLVACREWGLKYLYLGFYVAGNAHMKYKANYLPHERLIDGTWQRFE